MLAVGCPAPHAQVAPSTVFKLATRLPALSQANARNLSDIEWAALTAEENNTQSLRQLYLLAVED